MTLARVLVWVLVGFAFSAVLDVGAWAVRHWRAGWRRGRSRRGS